jgi:hypothetical protein
MAYGLEKLWEGIIVGGPNFRGVLGWINPDYSIDFLLSVLV